MKNESRLFNKVEFTKRVLQNTNRLNKFLNSIGYEFDDTKHKFISTEKGIYVTCSKLINADIFAITQNLFFPYIMSYSTYNINLIFLNDISCFEFDLDKNDKTKEWIDFLSQQFGYEFVNKHNKKVKAYKQILEQKNENSRTF